MLVLLPTSISKLTAMWQDSYTVVEQVVKVNYHIQMPDHRKKQTVFHVNILRKWHTPAATGFLSTCVPTDKEVDDIPSWKGAPATFQRMVNKLLNGMLDFASTYIDDVIVFSKNWKDHMYQVLKRIQRRD